jgi:SIR2-like domain
MNSIRTFTTLDLLDRLDHTSRRIAFVVGSGLAMPCPPEKRGVPGVKGVVDLISRELGDPALPFVECDNLYQRAFQEVLGRRGADASNRIVREAVLKARGQQDSPEVLRRALDGDPTTCRELDRDFQWVLSPGLKALGELLAKAPSRFSNYVLTSNFDPLIEVSLHQCEAPYLSVLCDRDVSLEHNLFYGYQIVHFHGYWGLRSTLHDLEQLRSERNDLRNSFQKILSEETVVVLGYGGWDDMFTSALLEVLKDHTREPDVLWCLRSPATEGIVAQPIIQNILNAQESLHSVKFYCGVNAHEMLPLLNSATPLQRLDRPRKRIPLTNSIGLAFDASDARRAVVRNFARLWGVDRGSFVGILSGPRDPKVLSILQCVEEAVCKYGDNRFLPRSWYKLEDNDAQDFEDDDAYGAASAGITGLYLELASGSDSRLLAYVNSFRGKIEAGRVAIVAHIIDDKPDAAADRARRIRNRIRIAEVPIDLIALPVALPVRTQDGSHITILTAAGKKIEQLTSDDRVVSQMAQQFRDEKSFSSNSLDESLLSPEMRAVCSYARGEMTEDAFLRTSSIVEFDRAIRSGVPFPNAIKAILTLEQFNPEIWFLLNRLAPTNRTILQMVALAPSIRGAFGLVTNSEWNDLDEFTRNRILERREGRPFCIPGLKAAVWGSDAKC